MTKAELKAFDGGIIPSIIGTITKVFDRKTGTNAHGEWAFQGAKLKMENGEEIDIKFADFDDQSRRKGQAFHAISTKGEKGMHGLKVELYKENPQVIVRKTADILSDNGHAPASQPAPASQQKPTGASSSTTQAAPRNDVEAIHQIGDLYQFCGKEACRITKKENWTNLEHMRSVTSCIFIEANKRGLVAPKATVE